MEKVAVAIISLIIVVCLVRLYLWLREPSAKRIKYALIVMVEEAKDKITRGASTKSKEVDKIDAWLFKMLMFCSVSEREEAIHFWARLQISELGVPNHGSYNCPSGDHNA